MPQAKTAPTNQTKKSDASASVAASALPQQSTKPQTVTKTPTSETPSEKTPEETACSMTHPRSPSISPVQRALEKKTAGPSELSSSSGSSPRSEHASTSPTFDTSQEQETTEKTLSSDAEMAEAAAPLLARTQRSPSVPIPKEIFSEVTSLASAGLHSAPPSPVKPSPSYIATTSTSTSSYNTSLLTSFSPTPVDGIATNKEVRHPDQPSTSSAAVTVPSLDGKVSPTLWFAFADVLINRGLFEKGIFVVAPDPNGEDFTEGSLADANKFDLNSRALFFGKTTDPKAFRIAEGLFRSLQTFGDSVDVATPPRQDAVISNPKRREEIFLPLVIPNSDHQRPVIGFNVYPWLSKNGKDFKFNGFEQVVTAGCMFGGNLKGVNQLGRAYPLVKYDVKFLPTEQIVRIDCSEKTLNPYEEMIFAELTKQASLIDRLSKVGKEKQLHYHLPYCDYMLFGIELFIRGRMTMKALNQFFTIILKKKEAYTERVTKICATYGIAVKIESPFDNLFGSLIFDKYQKDKIVQVVLERLGFSCTEVSPEMDSEKQKQLELQFVTTCLQGLQQNTFKVEHQRVWQDFMRTAESQPQTIEDLFKVANASMLAIAAAGKPDFTTCSLLPLSEKQIQLEYQRYSKQCGYPGVFNITTLDPVISYDETDAHGLLFYFTSDCKLTIAQLIAKQGILNHMHENVARFAQKTESIPIQQVLTSPSPTP